MIFSMSAEEWDLVIRVHLRGHFVTTRFATAYWREARKAAGRQVYARIVNTSSEAFLLGSIGQPNYAAAKAGIAALTVSTARSCARGAEPGVRRHGARGRFPVRGHPHAGHPDHRIPPAATVRQRGAVSPAVTLRQRAQLPTG